MWKIIKKFITQKVNNQLQEPTIKTLTETD